MDDTTIDAMEKDYLRGFNDGYVIASQLPELATQLSHPSLTAPWFEGFRDGREQWVQERVKDLRPEWMRRDSAALPAPEQADRRPDWMSRETKTTPPQPPPPQGLNKDRDV